MGTKKEEMINPADLRIGNWINDPLGKGYNNPGPVQVESINRKGINEWNDMGQSGCIGWEEAEPIPLTPEWLERCGFTWDEENQVYSIQIGNALYLEYDKDFDCAINPESWPGGSTYVWGENKSVHRLQNLFYDLTGEQLEIKLP